MLHVGPEASVNIDEHVYLRSGPKLIYMSAKKLTVKAKVKGLMQVVTFK